jgi:hypothetical protein
MEEEDNIIVKWAQEDVETSYSVLNNNNKILSLFGYELEGSLQMLWGFSISFIYKQGC